MTDKHIKPIHAVDSDYYDGETYKPDNTLTAHRHNSPSVSDENIQRIIGAGHMETARKPDAAERAAERILVIFGRDECITGLDGIKAKEQHLNRAAAIICEEYAEIMDACIGGEYDHKIARLEADKRELVEALDSVIDSWFVRHCDCPKCTAACAILAKHKEG